MTFLCSSPLSRSDPQSSNVSVEEINNVEELRRSAWQSETQMCRECGGIISLAKPASGLNSHPQKQICAGF
jgi:hypothetical protein